jgi:transcriptional regulator with PAS, ATPase and Fis domain
MTLTDEFFRDASAIHRRAMQSLFQRLDSLCEGAIAVDRRGRIVWVNDKYMPLLGIARAEDAMGRDVEELIPNSLMRQVVDSGEPILVDIMELNGRQVVVTRMPLEDDDGRVIGAIGFVLYNHLHLLKPLVGKFARIQAELTEAQQRLAEQRRPRYVLADYIGDTQEVVELRRLARLAAGRDSPVLLLGETGTGKELLAQAIHNAGGRREKPFVGINVAAVPENLLEAEFFGVAAGAYTGADRHGRIGKLKVADGGTLFLDEIGDMPLALQAKLLRALQEQEFEPLGSNKVIRTDVRVIAATNANLEAAMAQGRFRSDLYYRLNVLTIRLPPLRAILPDLPALCATFLDQIRARVGGAKRRVAPDGLASLATYAWPGNMRELRNVLERASMLTDRTSLGAAEFRDMLPRPADAGPPVKGYAAASAEFERRTLAGALAATGGRAADAARLLGMSRANFYKKLARTGLAEHG